MEQIKTNMPPADELAWIRQQIGTLRQREAQIREQVLAGEAALQGNEWDISVCDGSMRRFSASKARKLLPAEVLKQLMSDRPFKALRLRKSERSVGDRRT